MYPDAAGIDSYWESENSVGPENFLLNSSYKTQRKLLLDCLIYIAGRQNNQAHPDGYDDGASDPVLRFLGPGF